VSNLMPEVPREVHVGDVGRRLSFAFLKATRLEVQTLTGYAAWVKFWYGETAPHVTRACAVDGVNGLAIYELLGDEYTTVGELLVQFTVSTPDWYAGGAPGRFFARVSSDIIRMVVKRRPT